jgi:hypothetical protein
MHVARVASYLLETFQPWHLLGVRNCLRQA